jgi:hypothetical protein
VAADAPEVGHADIAHIYMRPDQPPFDDVRVRRVL